MAQLGVPSSFPAHLSLLAKLFLEPTYLLRLVDSSGLNFRHFSYRIQFRFHFSWGPSRANFRCPSEQTDGLASSASKTSKSAE